MPGAQAMFPFLQVSPSDLSFGSQQVGSTSSSQAVTISAVGSPGLSIIVYSISLTGSNPSDFSFSPNPGKFELFGGQSTTVNVTFDPTMTGPRSATLSVTSDGGNADVTLTGTGTPAPPKVSLKLITVDPARVIGGQTAHGRVVLSGPAPPGGASMYVLSQNPEVVLAPGTVTVDAGQDSATFTFPTKPVTKSQQATIYSSYGGGSASATLTVDPPSTPPVNPPPPPVNPPPPPGNGTVSPTPTSSVTLKSFVVEPNRLVGGGTAIGTVTLTGPAPVGGANVILATGERSVAPVPDLLPVPPGQTTASFPIPTSPVGGTTVVTLGAAYGGVSLAAILTVLAEATEPPNASERLVAVPDPVPARGRLALIQIDPDPSKPDHAVTAIKGGSSDGALWLVDCNGTALLSLVPGRPAQIRLDTSFRDPATGVGLARLLKVETSPSGVSSVLALMADNTRRLYRLSKDGVISILGAFPDPRGTEPLAISPRGDIAYVAPDIDRHLTLVQVTPDGRFTPLLSEGQEIGLGAPIKGFSDLTSSDDGQLAVLVRGDDGSPEGVPLAVLRLRGTERTVVAAVGTPVEFGRGAGVTGALGALGRPQIGPDGTIVFQGAGAGFANFYIQGPGQPLQPILPGSRWSTEAATYDYTANAAGFVALRAAPAGSRASHLYLRLPTGGVLTVVRDQADRQPIGQPVFGPDGRLFFLAENGVMSTDRNGRNLVGLYRALLDNNGKPFVLAVAEPRQAIPGWADAHLLSITQRPVVIDRDLYFGVVFGGPESFPVPSAALFRVPMDGTLAQGTLVAAEGQEMEPANRLAMPRDVALRGDGGLVLYGLLPGAGPLIATVTSTATTASLSAHSAATAATAIHPLMATGDDLQPGLLENVLPPLLSVGLENVLFVARTSSRAGAAREANREGLYLVKQERQGQSVAVTSSRVPDLPDFVFSGLADDQPLKERIFNLSPQSVAGDGSVVFKARLRWSGEGVLPRDVPPLVGVFRWNGAADPISVLLSDTRVERAIGPAPQTVERVAAGPGGRVYSLVKGEDGRRRLLASSVAARATTLIAPLVERGTKLEGGGQLTELTDFVISGSGDLYVTGSTTVGQGLFRLPGGEPGPLQPVVLPGTLAPGPPGDPQALLTFGDGPIELLPGSALGEPLLFSAQVLQRSQATMGQFTEGPDGLRTLCTNLVLVKNGGRNQLVYRACPDTVELQNRRGDRVFADIDDRGRWSITRVRVNDAGKPFPPELIARHGQPLQNVPGRKIVTLDAGPLLETDTAPRNGPVFTINAAGDVAYMASDGISWGAYRMPAK